MQATFTRGVTAIEFAQMCDRYYKVRLQGTFPLATVIPFLEHCCSLHLVAKVTDDRGEVRHVATNELGTLFVFD